MEDDIPFGEKFCLKEYYPEDSKTLYRYMDFWKFEDIISRKALFFSRGDKFEDQYEGLETELSKSMRRAVHNDDSYNENSKFYDRNRRCLAVHCWHISDFESTAMWKQFAREIDGIAIRTTVKRIKSALNSYGKNLCIRNIKYVENHLHEFTPFGCPFFPFLVKRKEYAKENELRIIYGEGKGCIKESMQYFAPEIPYQGIMLTVDPSVLIQDVILSPQAPIEFFNDVKKIITINGLNISIINSSIQKLI